MTNLKRIHKALSPYLAKTWVQWTLAVLVIFCFSLLYMGKEVYDCSSSTAALGSDSTGGFAWMQWASGNHLSWAHTDKSNYPFGENLGRPQYITSAILIFIYKLFSSVTTPICGLNLLVLLGYMSSGLVMFGFIKWLLGRFDIALFAAYAAAFVPYHQIKSQSHINYIYGSIFIGIIWAYLWLISRPSYKRAAVFGLVSLTGYYFDGYFVLITSILLAGLISSSYSYDLLWLLVRKDSKHRQQIIDNLLTRTKFLAAGIVLLGLLSLPILMTYKNNSTTIQHSLAAGRSNIKSETLLYGLRPIELVIPAYNNPLMPDGFQDWRATKLHGSNFSEDSLYIGYTVLGLAIIGAAGWFFNRNARPRLPHLPYRSFVFIMTGALIGCFLFSLPYRATVLGHFFRTPVAVLIKLTANWRVLSRFFLAMDPLFIILASCGLHIITRNRARPSRLLIVLVCSILLFLEYLPASFGYAQDLYKDAPSIYKKIKVDPSIKVVAEYPLADFKYTPTIFTYQPVYDKPLVNANDGSIARGPFDSAIAGLNDPQTLGVLKQLGVGVIVLHAAQLNNPNVETYLYDPIRNKDGDVNLSSSLFAYKIKNTVASKSSMLVMQNGFSDLSEDDDQISHRSLISEATMQVIGVKGGAVPQQSAISFFANSECSAPASLKITQDGHLLWSGQVAKTPVPINFIINDKPFSVRTANCVADITKLNSESSTGQ